MYENLSFENAIRTEKSAKKTTFFFEKKCLFSSFFWNVCYIYYKELLNWLTEI